MAATGAQASRMSLNAARSSIWITRISVGANSRPSAFCWRPVPPKKLSTTANTSAGSSANSALPRSGLMRIRLRLLGSASDCA